MGQCARGVKWVRNVNAMTGFHDSAVKRDSLCSSRLFFPFVPTRAWGVCTSQTTPILDEPASEKHWRSRSRHCGTRMSGLAGKMRAICSGLGARVGQQSFEAQGRLEMCGKLLLLRRVREPSRTVIDKVHTISARSTLETSSDVQGFAMRSE